MSLTLARGKEKVLEWLLITLIFLAPISRAGANLFSFLIILLWLINKLSNFRKPQKRNQDIFSLTLSKWLFIYGIIILLSLVNAVDIWDGLHNFISEYFKYAVIFLVTLEIIKGEEQFRRLWLTLPCSASIVLIYGIYEHFIMAVPRIYTTFSNPNPAATYFLMISLLSIAFMLFNKNMLFRLLGFSFGLLGIINLIISGSRGAWLGFIAGFGLIIFFVVRNTRIFKNKKAVIIFLLFILAFVFLLPDQVINRFKSIINLADSSIQQRLMMYSTGLKMIKEHPLLGVGTGQFKLVYGAYKPEKARLYSHIHNFYLHLTVETGLLGLSGFIILMFKIFNVSISKWSGRNKWFHYGMIGLLVGVAVHNLFDWTFLHTQVGLFLVILVAIWLNNINEEKGVRL